MRRAKQHAVAHPTEMALLEPLYPGIRTSLRKAYHTRRNMPEMRDRNPWTTCLLACCLVCYPIVELCGLCGRCFGRRSTQKKPHVPKVRILLLQCENVLIIASMQPWGPPPPVRTPQKPPHRVDDTTALRTDDPPVTALKTVRRLE